MIEMPTVENKSILRASSTQTSSTTHCFIHRSSHPMNARMVERRDRTNWAIRIFRSVVCSATVGQRGFLLVMKDGGPLAFY